jgi:hypothetical protein
MPPRLLTLVAAIGLLMAIATAALWLRSVVAPQVDFFIVISPSKSYGLGTEHGAIIGFLQLEQPQYRSNVSSDIQVVRAGFRFLRITSGGMRRYNLVVPFWFLTAVWLVPPLLWVARRNKIRRRRRNNLCVTCGYDLRASSGRCPECGTALRAEAR